MFMNEVPGIYFITTCNILVLRPTHSGDYASLFCLKWLQSYDGIQKKSFKSSIIDS